MEMLGLKLTSDHDPFEWVFINPDNILSVVPYGGGSVNHNESIVELKEPVVDDKKELICAWSAAKVYEKLRSLK